MMLLKDCGRAYRTTKGTDERTAGIDTLQKNISSAWLARTHLGEYGSICEQKIVIFGRGPLAATADGTPPDAVATQY